MKEARRTARERDKNAFQPKFDLASQAGHTRGCRCRVSECLKGYCECFNAGVRCGLNCTCVECKNQEGNADLEKLLFGPQVVKRMKLEEAAQQAAAHSYDYSLDYSELPTWLKGMLKQGPDNDMLAAVNVASAVATTSRQTPKSPRHPARSNARAAWTPTATLSAVAASRISSAPSAPLAPTIDALASKTLTSILSDSQLRLFAMELYNKAAVAPSSASHALSPLPTASSPGGLSPLSPLDPLSQIASSSAPSLDAEGTNSMQIESSSSPVGSVASPTGVNTQFENDPAVIQERVVWTLLDQKLKEVHGLLKNYQTSLISPRYQAAHPLEPRLASLKALSSHSTANRPTGEPHDTEEEQIHTTSPPSISSSSSPTLSPTSPHNAMDVDHDGHKSSKLPPS